MTKDLITEEIVRLKTLVDLGKLILTWDQMATIVGLENGEQARGRYRNWVESHPPVNEVSENHLVLNTLGDARTITAEQLLDLHGIDRDVWEVARQSVRKWDGFSKIADRDLKFEGGKISGHIKEEGKLNLVELSYIRVELVRKKPILLEPSLAKIDMGPLDLPEPLKDRRTNHLVVYIPDPHFPYQDDRSLDLILHFCVANRERISHIIWGGDVLDLREFSTFLDLREDDPPLQKALYQAGAWLLRFRQALPKIPMTYLEGNHEKRLRIQLKKNLPALYGLKAFKKEVSFPVVSIPTLLSLDELKIEYIQGYPEGEYYWIDGVAYAHGTIYGRFGSGLTKLLKEINHDIMTGHDHRIQQGSKTIWLEDGPKMIQVAITGWTGDLQFVPPGRKLSQDWQTAFGVVSYFDGDHRLEVLPIINEKIFWGSEIYEF